MIMCAPLHTTLLSSAALFQHVVDNLDGQNHASASMMCALTRDGAPCW